MVLKEDGTVWACGWNSKGELGLNDTTNRNTFTQVTENVSDVKKIICSNMSTLMLKNDGTLWGTGDNS
jgi:alpha-tubulin suppressor-like RCC1 family protein